DVHVLTRRRGDVEVPDGVRVVRVDLRDRDEVRRALRGGGYQAVCHLAALTRVRDSFADPLAYYEVNLGWAPHPLQPVPDSVRFVYTSSNSVYGTQTGRLTEDIPPSPTSPYAASKLRRRAGDRLPRGHRRAGCGDAAVLQHRGSRRRYR